MGVLEDLQGNLSTLGTRVSGFERGIERADSDLARMAAEHAAIGRRLGALEAQSTQGQRDEVDAIGRRVGLHEGLVARKHDELRAEVLAQIAPLAQAASLEALAVQFETLRSMNAAAHEIIGDSLDGHQAHIDHLYNRLNEVAVWRVQQEAWNALPWWKRLWWELRGRRFEITQGGA